MTFIGGGQITLYLPMPILAKSLNIIDWVYYDLNYGSGHCLWLGWGAEQKALCALKKDFTRPFA